MAALTGLERLRTDLLADPRFRLALAESHRTPTASKESPLLLALLRNPNTPGEALEAIACDDPSLEERLHRHPNLASSRP